jgi:hypothetical protein
MRQLEWNGRNGKGWGKSLPPKVDELHLQGVLVDVACKYIEAQAIHIDETQNDQLWQRSRVKWAGRDSWAKGPQGLEVYYHKASIMLPVLAHEVGHLETMNELGGIKFYASNERNRYHAEAMASKWALEFLAGHGIAGKRWNECAALLQGCLDGYRPAGAVRYQLASFEDIKKGGC